MSTVNRIVSRLAHTRAGRARNFAVVVAITALASSLAGTSAFAQTLRTDFWGTNGTVRSMARAGNVLYIAGDFTFVAPSGGGAAVALDATTGAFQPGIPTISGVVIYAILPDNSGGWYLGGWQSSGGGGFLERVLANGSVAWIQTVDNGVYSLALSGTTLYVGGNFQNIGGLARNSIAALSAVDGSPLAAFNANVMASNTVKSIVVSGSTLYLGGYLLTVGGATRQHLATVHATTGAVLPSWAPTTDWYVNSLLLDGNTMYVGGEFTTAGGQTRNRLAAFDATTGALASWNPNVTGAANVTIASLVKANGTIIAGGKFTAVGGLTRRSLAAIHPLTGVPTSWDPGPDSTVGALYLSGSALIVGGAFAHIAGVTRTRIASLDPSTGATLAWAPSIGGSVYALAAAGNTVCVGGYSILAGGVVRNHLAAVDVTTGMPTAWNPDADGAVQAIVLNGTTLYAGGDFITVGGLPRAHLVAIDAATGATTAWNPGANRTVTAMANDAATLYVGGKFTNVGGAPRSRLAAFDEATGTLLSWAPAADSNVFAIAVGKNSLFATGVLITPQSLHPPMPGSSVSWLKAFDRVTSAPAGWNAGLGSPCTYSNVDCLIPQGTSVYVAGNCITKFVDGATRMAAFRLDQTTAAAAPWYPFGAAVAAVYAMSVDGNTIYMGGGFATLGGQPRSSLGAVDATTGLASPWAPGSNDGYVQTILADATGVFVGGQFTHFDGLNQSGLAAYTAAPARIITATADPGGTISPSGAFRAGVGSSQTFTIAADGCHSIADVSVDGVSVGTVGSYTFTNVTADHTIAASFTAAPAYTITASAGSGGSITPSGAIPAACGANVAFVIAANPGYHIADVVVDGFSAGAFPSYTFANVGADHAIVASFALNPAMQFDFEPHDLNLNSNGAYVTGYLTPGAPYSPYQIDVASLRLNAVVPVSIGIPATVEHDTTLAVKFTRAAVLPTLTAGTQIPVTVTGTIAGINFEYQDTIKVSAAKLSAPALGATLAGGAIVTAVWAPQDAPAPSVTVVSSFDDGVTWSIEAQEALNSGTYDWRVPETATSRARLAVIRIHDTDGTGIVPESEFAVSDAFSIQPTLGVGPSVARFALRPANPVTGPLSVSFSLTSDAKATLDAYDISGRCVATREAGALGAGWHVVSLGQVPAGIYVVRLSQAGRSIASRVVVMR